MPKRPTKKTKNPVQTIFSRFLFIVAIFVIWIGVIGVRLVHLQVNQSDWLREKALDQRRDETKSKQFRGSILDRSERTLALSIKVKSLAADPREIEDVQATAAGRIRSENQTAGNFKTSRKPRTKIKDSSGWRENWTKATSKKSTKRSKTKTLKSRTSRAFKGLHWREEQKRSYPYGTLASQVVGFSNLDDVGQAGIELSQEQNLRGAVIKSWQIRDRLGRVYDESETEEREPPRDVVLTISHSIQYKVEEALKKGVEASQAKSGMAIVLNPKTGEVLAMANYPTFDPNRFGEFPKENITNRAVQSIYSPGSVFKIVTYGGALQENLISPGDMLDCGKGFIETGGRKFQDKHCVKSISYTEAMAVSSNIGAIKTGLRLGKDRFYNYIREFRLRRADRNRASGGSSRAIALAGKLERRQLCLDVDRLRNRCYGFANCGRLLRLLQMTVFE
jgi:cell division protein FtsI (penicillin-binding protein 3)